MFKISFLTQNIVEHQNSRIPLQSPPPPPSLSLSLSSSSPHLPRFVGPYTHLCPDLSFVLEDSRGVCGYVLAALDSQTFYNRYRSEWLPRLDSKYPPPPPPESGNSSERVRYMHLITVEPPIKDTPNKEHLSIKDKSVLVPVPIIPVHFNLRIKETSL